MSVSSWFRCALLILAALQAGCSAVVLRTSCEAPRVSNFGVPSSYMVVLPYRYAGDDAANRASAKALNRLANLQTLRRAVDMEGTQITLIDGDPREPQCDIERVFDRVTEDSVQPIWRRPFHSAVFTWGEIFDGDDGLLVQSHVRVFWNGRESRDLEVSVDSPALQQPLRFGGSLPSTTVSFPPLAISRDVQHRLIDAAKGELIVRADRRVDAARAELPEQILGVSWRRPWLELGDRVGGPSVYLKLDESDAAERALLPATVFAQAMAAYLNHRVDGDAASRAQAVEAFNRFRESIDEATLGDAQATSPLALANAMEGALGLPTRLYLPPNDAQAPSVQQINARSAVPRRAQETLAEAARQLPSNGDLLNLAAIAKIPGCCDSGDYGGRLRDIQQLFERAERADRGNLVIARNLVNWYGYLLTLPADQVPLAQAELKQRRFEAQQSLSAWVSLQKQ